MSGHDTELISHHQSRKQANIATAPTAALAKPRLLVAEPAPEVELAAEELELALSAAEAADEDTEVLLPVALVEELEAEDFEAVDEAALESAEEA